MAKTCFPRSVDALQGGGPTPQEPVTRSCEHHLHAARGMVVRRSALCVTWTLARGPTGGPRFRPGPCLPASVSDNNKRSSQVRGIQRRVIWSLESRRFCLSKSSEREISNCCAEYMFSSIQRHDAVNQRAFPLVLDVRHL